MTAPDEKNQAREKKLQDLKDRVGRSFDDYRKSGLALMATVIALSSGGLAALLQNVQTRSLAFFLLIPIAFAVLQQLSHYLGSKASAHSDLEKLYQTPGVDEESYLKAYIGERIHFMHANLYFGISDNLSWLACLSLGLATLWPLFVLAKRPVALLVVTTVVLFLGFWAWRWLGLKREIDNTVW